MNYRNRKTITSLFLCVAMTFSFISPFQTIAFATETETDQGAAATTTVVGTDAAADQTAPETSGSTEKTPEEIAAEQENMTKQKQQEVMKANFSKLPKPDNTVPEGYEQVAQNEKLTLFAKLDTGDIILQNNENGYLWRSTPALLEQDEIAKSSGKAYTNLQSALQITYSQGFSSVTINSRQDIVDAKNMTCEKIENGIKCVYTIPKKKSEKTTDFREQFTGQADANKEEDGVKDETSDVVGFVIPVSYTLENDAFVAKILLSDPQTVLSYTNLENVTLSFATVSSVIKQNVDYNITEIDLLPNFGAGGLNEEGYMIIPDGSGAIVRFNNGRNLLEPYKAPVYGAYIDTETAYAKLNDNVRLPIIGVVNEDAQNGNNALLGIITENEASAMVNARVSNYDSSYNTVYTTVVNKIIQAGKGEDMSQPMANSMLAKNKDYTVKYYPMAGDDANYTGMARRYQKYLVDELGLQKNEDQNEQALYLDMYAGVERETSILGIPTSIFDVLTSMEDLRGLVDELNGEGINDIVIKYNDWMKKSSRGKVASKTSVERKIGGKSGLKETISFMEEKNVDFYPNIDFINYSRNGNGYSGFFDSAKGADMSPAFQKAKNNSHINLGDRWYLLKPNLVLEASNSFLTKYEQYGTPNISLESIGNTLYSDATSGGVSRGDTLYVWDEIIQNYTKDNGKVMLTNPNAFAFPYINTVLSAPDPITYAQIADEAIPFYQIALRGYVPYSSEPINLASDSKECLLRAVETGSGLTYSFVMRDPSGLKETNLNYLYSCDYDMWKDEMLEQYKQYSGVMKKIGSQQIKNHEKLAEGVYRTTYENDVAVIVNHSDTEYQVDGSTVAAGSYLALGGE